MLPRNWIIFGSAAVFSILLLVAFGITGAAAKLVSAAPEAPENNTMGSSPANPSLANRQNQSGTNASATASINQNNTHANPTAMPTEFEWDNWTTFELFEKYPILENLTSTNNNTTSASSLDNRTSSAQSSGQNETKSSLENMTAPLPSSNSSKYQNQTTVLTQLQNSVSSLNQSIAQLSNQVTSLNATIAVDNRVVNERGKLPTTTTAENASGAIEPAVSFAMSKRITGDLEKDDYIVLGHFANQSSAQIERQLQLKVPCDDDKQPKVKLLVGSISDTLTILDLGRAINKVSVEGSGEVTLSKPGDYCLYQAELPRDAADAILVNDSGGTLKLGDTRSYVTITNVISPTNY